MWVLRGPDTGHAGVAGAGVIVSSGQPRSCSHCCWSQHNTLVPCAQGLRPLAGHKQVLGRRGLMLKYGVGRGQ